MMMMMMIMMMMIIALTMMMIMKPHLRAKKLVPYCTAHNNTNVRELPSFLGLDLKVSFQNKFPAGEYSRISCKGGWRRDYSRWWQCLWGLSATEITDNVCYQILSQNSLL